LAAVGDGYTTAMTTLAAAFSANTGQDAAGVVFGRQYVNTGRDLLKAVTAGINALRTTGYGIQMSAVNYSRAEAASDISMRAQALPTPPCPAPVTSAAPPVPTGGGVAQPMLWAVVEFLVGDLWPNGDPTALRTAGAAWKTFGSALYHVSIDTAGPYNTVGAQQIPEAELIKAPIRDIGSMMSSLGGACQTLGNGLINYANDVEHAQQAIRDLLNKLGSIGGIVGTFFEFVKGHGDDELDEIVDDIKTVLHNMKSQVDAKVLLLETAKANVNTWAVGAEKIVDREFSDFFGEDVGALLAMPIHNAIDSTEGAFRWTVGMAEGIQGLDPLRFAYDPQGAQATWKSMSEFAGLMVPSLAPIIAQNDPEGVKNILKGIARVDEYRADRPMLGASQSLLDVLSLGLPGVGEAGAGADAASAAARVARSAEVQRRRTTIGGCNGMPTGTSGADEAAGVARATGRLSEVARATSSLADVGKQAGAITEKLDGLAGKPPTLEPPPGRPVSPTGPVEPPAAPVTRPSVTEAPVPRSEVPSPAPSTDAPSPAPVERALSPVETSHPPAEVPIGPAETPHGAPSSGAAPVDGGHPAGSLPHSPPPEIPHAPTPEVPHSAPAEAPPHPSGDGAHPPADGSGADHPGSAEHGPHDGDPGAPHDPGLGDGGPADHPQHNPNTEVEHDGQQPGAATEQQHQPVTNEPVDVATGEYLLPAVDIDLPGALPVRLTRQHRSQYRQGLWFGPSWTCTFDSRAVVTESAVTTIDADGTLLMFDHPAVGMPARARHGQRWTLHAEPGGGYRLDDPRAERSTHFSPLPHLNGIDAASGVLSISAITDKNDNRIAFEYNVFGVPERVTSTSGAVVDVDCRGGRIREYRVAGVALRRFDYEDGNLSAVTNGVGATTRFAYDDARRMVSWIDSSGAQYRNTYDVQGRVVSQTGADGIWAGTFEYAAGRTVFIDAVGNTTTYHFDGALRPVAVTDSFGRTNRTVFATGQDPLSRSDASGATITYRYDTDGHLSQLTDPLGRVLAFGYADGRPVEMRGPDGTLTRYDYDARGNLVAIHDPVGGLRRWEYDRSGAVIAYTDPLGRRTAIINSAAGLPHRIIDGLGNETLLKYDAFGRVVSATAADGAVTSMSYDNEGRLTSRVTADGSRETWVYDGEGNCVAFTNPAGALTRWEYGYYDLVTARIDADGGRTTYGYNEARQLISVTNPAGLVWQYDYGPDGLLESETDFNQATTRYTYDVVGRVASRTNAVGQTIEYRYDAAGQLISEAADDEVVTYEYDAAGRRTSATNVAGRLDLKRDGSGRVVAESWNGRTITSKYDIAGNLVEIRTPSGLPVSVGYDGRGTANSLTVAGRPLAVGTDAMGRPTTYRYGTTEVSSTWDALGRLISRAVDIDDAGVLASVGYRYRLDGELADVSPGPGGSALGTLAHYDVDPAGRLTAQTLTDGTRHDFRFDASENVHLGDQRWEYRGVLLTDDGRSRYSYDRAGRLTTVSTRRLGRKPDVWQYRWDAWDRLRELTTPDGTVYSYHYDPLGRRVSKTSSSEERVDFSWAGARMVEQVSSRTGVTSWAYLPGELTPQIQVTQNEVDREFFALVTDQVGAPVAVLDPASGTIAGQSIVTAWGSATWTGESTPWRFPGQYFDEESGLHYNFHRYYNPAAGRYISPDPLGLAPAPNPYSYPTNPTGWIDPLGLNPCQGGPPQISSSGSINPQDVLFTQDSIKGTFTSGGSVDDLISGLQNGTIHPTDLPPIRLVQHDGQLFSLDNRRLFAFKAAGVDEIPYVLATPQEVVAEWTQKFTTQTDGTTIRVRGRS